MKLTECLRLAKNNGYQCAGFYGNPLENHSVQHWASLDLLLSLVLFNPKYSKLNHDHWTYGKYAAQIFVSNDHWVILHLYKEDIKNKLANSVKAEQEAEEKRLQIAKKIILKREAKSKVPEYQDWWEIGGWGLT